MHRSFRRSAAVCALLGASASWPSIALAQSAATTPAPVHQTIDENGVDLPTGQFHVSVGTSIGTAESGMTWERAFRGGAYRDTGYGTMYTIGTTTTVSIGRHSEEFIKSGTTFTPKEATGSTLTLADQLYSYTQSDGTVATYVAPSSGTINGGSDVPLLNSITAPSGERTDFFYASGQLQVATTPDGTKIYMTVRRFASTSNNKGWGARASYVTDTLDHNSVGLWQQLTKITMSNGFGGACGTGCTLPSINFDPNNSSIYTDATGRVTQLTFSNGAIVGVRRPGRASDHITVTYANNLVSSVTNEGVTTTYSYADSSDLRTVTITRASLPPRSMVFQISTGLLKSETDATGRTTTYDYVAGRLTTVTAPELNKVVYAYDGRGNQTSATSKAKPGSGLADITTSAKYPDTCTNPVICNKPETITDARLNVTNYTYDPVHGGVLTVKAPATPAGVRPEVRFSYAQLGALGSPASGQSGIWTPTGTSVCRTTASCLGTADEARTTINYGSNLLPATVASAAGDGSLAATTTYSYGYAGNVTAVDGPLPGAADTTTYRYDPLWRLSGVIAPDPDGGGPLKRRAERMTYDAAGRVTVAQTGIVTDASDAGWAGFAESWRTSNFYNGNSRLIRRTSWSSGTDYGVQDYLYDAAGRPTCQIVYMNSTTWGPQASACAPLQTNGPQGPDRVKRTEYDAAGRVTKVQSGVGTAAESDDATATYTANGQAATATDAEGNRTGYTYDGHDRLAEVHYPDKTVAGVSSASDYEGYAYDTGGNVTQRRLRGGNTVSYGYDALGRLLHRSPGGMRGVAYGYDLQGRMTEAAYDWLGGPDAVRMSYDALGRLSATSNTMGGTTRTLAYQYDAAGNRTRLTHGDGVYFTYFNDTLGRFTNASWYTPAVGTVPFFGIGFDDLGRRTVTGRASSTTTYGYDAISRMTNIAQNFAGGAGNTSNTLGYNPAGQISSFARSNDDYAFRDIDNVNRNQAVNGLNQYTSAGPATFTYDSNGNLTGDGTRTYGYDAENRLVSSGSVTLTYDPLGRLWQTAGGSLGNTQFVYDGDALVAEYDGDTGAMRRRYFHGPGIDEPVLWDEGSAMNCSGTKFLHNDERGSIVALADCWGNRVAVNAYDEYGIPKAGTYTPALPQRFQYTGQAWIPELGIYYYKARMYSPTLGRFLQTDPIGYGDGMNWYNYVGGDPINRADPSGTQFSCSLLGGASSANDSRGSATAVTCSGEPDIPEIVVTGRSPLPADYGDDIVVTGTRPPPSPSYTPPFAPMTYAGDMPGYPGADSLAGSQNGFQNASFGPCKPSPLVTCTNPVDPRVYNGIIQKHLLNPAQGKSVFGKWVLNPAAFMVAVGNVLENSYKTIRPGVREFTGNVGWIVGTDRYSGQPTAIMTVTVQNINSPDGFWSVSNAYPGRR